MRALIEGFPQQLNEALAIAAASKLSLASNPIHSVVIAGMGGSGIGGNLVQAITGPDCKVPITISKSYDIPAFISASTLFIACSFSGNTEETLDALAKAHKAGAKIVCITSGGKMGAFAAAYGCDVVSIPGHSNSPRSSIGYSYVQLLNILAFHKLTPTAYTAELEAAQNLLATQAEAIENAGKALAHKFSGKLPFLYADSRLEAVVVRTQQQIAENSKHIAHANVFPEMNHNELVGWVHPEPIWKQAVVLLLRTSFDHQRTSIRMDICKGIFEKVCAEVIELKAEGKSFVEQALHLILVLDWASFYLAELNGVDPFPVEFINYLKDELAKHS